jgi:hypothetical protein
MLVGLGIFFSSEPLTANRTDELLIERCVGFFRRKVYGLASLNLPTHFCSRLLSLVLTLFSGVNHSTRTVAVLSAQGRTVCGLTQG